MHVPIVSSAAAWWLHLRTQRKMHGRGNPGQYAVEFPTRFLAGRRVDCERRGLSWRLALDDLAQRLLFAVGVYEGALVDWLTSELEPDDVVLDVGGHVGLLTIPLADRLRDLGGTGRVIAFEPAPDSYEAFLHHVAINGLRDRVEVVNAALGERRGQAVLSAATATDDPSQRSLHAAERGDGVTVDVLNFDEWWLDRGGFRIDVMKMDVEGGELAALSGMRKALGAAGPRLLVVELKDELAAMAGSSTEDVVRLLAELGYERDRPISELIGSPNRIPHVDVNAVFRRTEEAEE